MDNRPNNKKLFLNIDPDVAITSNHVSYWIKCFSLNQNITVEIIENSDLENILNVESFIDWMEEYNVDFAYDDYAKPNSIYTDTLFHKAKVIKLDIDIIRTIRKKIAYKEIAKD